MFVFLPLLWMFVEGVFGRALKCFFFFFLSLPFFLLHFLDLLERLWKDFMVVPR